MAYLEKVRKTWRLRDRVGADIVTVSKNLGVWRQYAEIVQTAYRKIKAQGAKLDLPTTAAEIIETQKALEEGRDPGSGRRITIAEMCEIYLKNVGASLKGGYSTHHASPYHHLELSLTRLKATPCGEDGRTWGEMLSDEPNPYHVRDLLARYRTVGTKLRNLGAYGAIFNKFRKWNERGNVLKFQVRLPKYNPFTVWRSEMKPADKKEHPDKRVLSKAEWDRFKVHLSHRARQICEIALRRFLRLADIKAISQKTRTEKESKSYLHGRQQKTGEIYFVPAVAGAPMRYDFTNFKREFEQAQIKAEMHYPPEHPLHFSIKDLRRTGATWLYRATKDVALVSKMLGHSNLGTTKRYLNIDEKDLDQGAEKMDQLAADPEIPATQNVERRWSESRN